MVTYVVGTIISIIIAIVINKLFGFEKKKALKMFVAILPLTIISAFRYDVGWDYLPIYTNGFYYVGEYKLDWFSEPVFIFIIRRLYDTFEDPLSLFIFMSTMTSIFFSLSFKAYGKEKKYYLYIILFIITRYYFCSLNIARQALAMLILLYSVQFIKEKKFGKYLIFVLLATAFHQLSVIYIPLYFILSMDISKMKNIFIIVLSVPIAVLVLILFINGTKYLDYFNNMFGNDGSVVYSELLIALTVLIYGIPIYKKLKEDVNVRIFFNMQLIVLVLSILSFKLPTADRLIWYFSVQNIFLIPEILESYSNYRNRFIGSIIIYGIIIGICYNQIVINDSYSVLPYKNIIEVRQYNNY